MKSNNDTISLNPRHSPDGTYPPRLLGIGASVWLKDHISPILDYSDHSQHLVRAERNGQECYLVEYRVSRKNWEEHYDGVVVVNGVPLFEKHMFRDGDFALLGRIPLIFQADPVADRHRFSTDAFIETQSITLSSNLKKQLNVSESGISFHREKLQLCWDDIRSISFSTRQNRAIFTVYLIDNYQFKRRKLSSVTQSFSKRDLNVLTKWLQCFAPIDLSVLCTTWEKDVNLQDAYERIAFYKLVEPADLGKINLFSEREIVLGKQTPEERRRFLIKRWSMLAMGLLLLVLLIDERLRLIGVALACVLWLFPRFVPAY